MHRRFPVLLAFVLVAALVLAVGTSIGWASSPEAAEGVEVEMSASKSGSTITYSITLKNNTDKAVGDIFVAGSVAAGTGSAKITATPANAGAFGIVGGAEAWVSNGIAAKSKQGPFTYQVTITGTPGPANAFVRWRLPKAGSVVSASETHAERAVARVRAVYFKDHEVLPDQEVAVTLTAGYGKQHNNEITTTGLRSVGVGEFVYLEGPETDDQGDKIVSWKWTLGLPQGSAAKLEGSSTRMPRFRTDIAGTFQAVMVATDEVGHMSKSVVSVRAGRYAGVQYCASCHSGALADLDLDDIFSKWQTTGHSVKFEETWPSYPSSEYCVRCHTTGYNESAAANGFSDAAQSIGWDPKKDGAFLKWAKTTMKLTLDDLRIEPEIVRTMNIQCESCHGPGGSGHTKVKSFEPGVCGQCHQDNRQMEYFVNSAHAARPGEEFTNSGTCAACHTGVGFVEGKIRGNKLVTPTEATATNPATLPPASEMTGQTCATCHDPHVATFPFIENGRPKSRQLRLMGEVMTPQGVTVDAEEAAVCVSCHANRRTVQYLNEFLAGKQSRATHGNTQTDVLKGFGAVEFGKKFGSSYHAVGVKDLCVSCHMAVAPTDNPGPDGIAGNRDDVKVTVVGNHSFSMSGNWDFDTHKPGPTGKEVDNVNGCNVKGCHSDLTAFNRTARGDFDGDGKVEGVQDEVDGLLKMLAALLPKTATGAVMSSGINATNTSEIQRKALWNYTLMNNDGSKGVHNTRFTVEALQASIEALSGKPIPGAAKP